MGNIRIIHKISTTAVGNSGQQYHSLLKIISKEYNQDSSVKMEIYG